MASRQGSDKEAKPGKANTLSTIAVVLAVLAAILVWHFWIQPMLDGKGRADGSECTTHSECASKRCHLKLRYCEASD